MHFGSSPRDASGLTLTQIFTVRDSVFPTLVLQQDVGTWLLYLPQAIMFLWMIIAPDSGYCCSRLPTMHFVIALLHKLSRRLMFLITPLHLHTFSQCHFRLTLWAKPNVFLFWFISNFLLAQLLWSASLTCNRR